jgi:hypothetical protein
MLPSDTNVLDTTGHGSLLPLKRVLARLKNMTLFCAFAALSKAARPSICFQKSADSCGGGKNPFMKFMKVSSGLVSLQI